jgi:hypothetical protein
MMRALFLGLGLFVMVLGLEAMAIDSATVTNPQDTAAAGGSSTVTFTPADWVPWTLVSAGAVTILYSYTLPQKFKGGR